MGMSNNPRIWTSSWTSPWKYRSNWAGRRFPISDLLQLGQGSVIELAKLAGEPLEILVNQKLVARGEVVVINDKFGVRLTDIISPAERVKQLGTLRNTDDLGGGQNDSRFRGCAGGPLLADSSVQTGGCRKGEVLCRRAGPAFNQQSDWTAEICLPG